MNTRFAGICITILALACSAPGQLIYDASLPRKFNPSTDQFSLFYNLPGSRPRILIDDVTVPFAGPTSTFNVTRITVKISRATNAPAVRITPFFGQLLPDAAVNGGPLDLPEYPDPSAMTPFGIPQFLPATGAAPFQEILVSFGNGIDTLFTVPGSTAGGVAGFQSFLFGMDLTLAADSNSDTRVDARDLLAMANHWLQPSGGPQQGDFNLDGFVNQTDLTILAQSWQLGNGTLANNFARNGWTVATHPNNLDVLWDYTAANSFEDFTYGFDAFNNRIISTQYLQVEGQVLAAAIPLTVPDPMTGALCVWVIPFLVSRSARRAVRH